MTKLLCVKCHVSLRPETNGTTVIEMAKDIFGVKYPYKVWDADTWKCPICGIEIVAGYGNHAIRDDHYAPDFNEWLSKYKGSARRIEYDNDPN